MTYSDFEITLEEYNKYLENFECEKLLAIWSNLLTRIDDEKLQEEAKIKGFILQDNPDIEEDSIAQYKRITVKNPSEKLSQYFEEKLYTSVVCMKLY
jgi:hypothetical protein